MFLPSHPISNVWFELYLTFSYEFNFQIPFHDLFELNGVSFSVQTPEVSHTMALPQGATFVFGTWVCVANGSGGFESHLTNSPTLKAATPESLSKLGGSDDQGVMLLPDLAKEI